MGALEVQVFDLVEQTWLHGVQHTRKQDPLPRWASDRPLLGGSWDLVTKCKWAYYPTGKPM